MCGRFTLFADSSHIARQFSLQTNPALTPRYNAAPGQELLVIRRQPGADGNEGFSARWGLVPFWARDEKIGSRMINARIETAAQKPAFRDAFQKRRCLIPASGFYEWTPRGAARQPFYFYPSEEGESMLGGPCLPLAGIWESCPLPEGERVTFSILTTAANETVSAVHHRMPVTLLPSQFEQWLSAEPLDPASDFFTDLAAPLPAGAIARHPVAGTVNTAHVDQPQLIEPVLLPPNPQQQELL